MNPRINNMANRPFLQRDGIVQEVTAQIEQTQAVDPIKPRVVALWSPRGVGKTSLLRHLAEREEHAEKRERYCAPSSSGIFFEFLTNTLWKM